MKNLQPNFLKYFIYNSAFTSIMDTLATGTLLTAYALALGASPLLIGILGGLTCIGPVINVVGAYLVHKQYNIKKITVGFAFASRPFYLFCGLLAFFPGLPHAAVWLCVGIGICYLLGGISAGGFYPWLKAVLPQEQTHLFVARKYLAVKIAYIIGFLSAFFLIRIYSPGGGNPLLSVYAFIFGAAFLCGTVGTAFLLRVPSVSVIKKSVFWNWEIIKKILQEHINLLRVCGFSYFVSLFFITFVPVFALEVAKLSVAAVTILSLVGQVCFLVSLPIWKRLNEYFHALRSLQISFICSAIILIFTAFLLTSGSSMLITYLACFLILFASIVQAGIFIGVDAAVLLYAPKDQSPLFFTVVSWVRLAAALGPVTAGIFWTFIRRWDASWSVLSSWQLFFVVAALGCLVVVDACRRWKKAQIIL